MLAVEIRISGGNGVEPAGNNRTSLRNTLPPIRRTLGRIRGFWCDRLRRPVGKRDDFFRRWAHRLARGIWIVRRSFPARPLTQYTAQAQEDEYRKRQKYDGIN